ncbi:tyrosine-type recombinase/integrase [Nocardia otitidiscaviarum]|uniref:tyrosine-type recombinase/integrase n=1 Tax=Nocardia otitidiscaviarum TaxID=1823 RepID=UPI002454E3AE|nr:tyrosine-type recombinase/integrase [Nocardia otitidiscaviarum]
MALAPGELPPKEKLEPVQRADGLWELDRVRHRALNGEEVRTSATGRTKKACRDEWMRRFEANIRKNTKRKRTSRRVQFSPNDKMSVVFAELDRQWKQRVEAGTMSRDTYNNNYRMIYETTNTVRHNPNPDAFKLETELGSLTIAESADVADIIDYLDEVAETAPTRAEKHYTLLCQAYGLAVQGRAIPAAANPMVHVPRPAMTSTLPRPLDKAAQRAMFEFIDKKLGDASYLRIFYLLLLGTGVRPGEGLAVRWSDLSVRTLDDDAPKTVLYVGATVRWHPGVEVYRHENRKSGNPYRVALPAWLAAELEAERDRAKPASADSPIVVGSKSKSWVSVQTARQLVFRVRRDSPVPGFRLSDLRDTVATHLAVVTKDDERVSAQLGHTEGKLSMAQRHYIDGGVKRMMVVDNAEWLEALNPRVSGADRESGVD